MVLFPVKDAGSCQVDLVLVKLPVAVTAKSLVEIWSFEPYDLIGRPAMLVLEHVGVDAVDCNSQ